ncbi:hypothetical protein VD0001_g9907, partial [Verticillium dahliae]
PAASSPPPPPPPAAPPSRNRAGSLLRTSMLDPSAFTLSAPNGAASPSPTRSAGGLTSPPPPGGGGGPRYVVHDPRWKFQDDSMLPKPREFVGGTRKYRAGRGSSVPLDLAALSA